MARPVGNGPAGTSPGGLGQGAGISIRTFPLHCDGSHIFPADSEVTHATEYVDAQESDEPLQPRSNAMFTDSTLDNDDWASHASLDSKDYDYWRQSNQLSDDLSDWQLRSDALTPGPQPSSITDDNSSNLSLERNDALGIGIGIDDGYSLPENDPEEPPPRPNVEHALRNQFNRTTANIKRVGKRMMHMHEGPTEPMWYQMKEQDEQSPESEIARPVHARLRGKTLMIFGPTHPLRQALARLITQWWFEPAILSLIGTNLVVLIISSSRNVYKHPPPDDMLTAPEECILLGVFCCYTLEVLARIIVSGLVINPPAADSDEPWRSNTYEQLNYLWNISAEYLYKTLHPYDENLREVSASQMHTAVGTQQTSTDEVYGETNALFTFNPSEQNRSYREEKRGWWSQLIDWSLSASKRLQHTITMRDASITDSAYLRHSWNRVDFIAVVMYWVAAALSIRHKNGTAHVHLFIFRALSVLRCSRVLTLFEGTVTILLSLKRVAPLLLRVASFTGFAMVLFSVIGVQSFKGSYRRNCVWVGDMNNEPSKNVTLDQLCGGAWDPNNSSRTISYIRANGSLALDKPKGYLCPYGQLCIQGDSNPYRNVQGFDNVIMSMLQVSFVMSLNGWSDSMYDMVDADYYTACIYFIIGIILLNFWLANLFVAVISHSFAALSSETEHSAFAAVKMKNNNTPLPEETLTSFRVRRRRVAQMYKRFWSYTKYVWLALIVTSLGVQASQAAFQFESQRRWRSQAEQGFTIAFAAEIILRFLAYVLDGDARGFVDSRQNLLDLFLAVVTSIIQIPVIKNSRTYAWFTVFQLARFYRVIAAVPRLRALLLRVVGSMKALVNMVIFLVLTIFVAALFSVQLFRGDIEITDDGEPVEMTWKHLWNGFLGMYQIFSSENWSSTAMTVIGSERRYKQGVIAGIFLVSWFIFSNLIVLQMFIVVINENFRVAEGDKYKQQMEHYLRRTEPPKLNKLERLHMWLSPFRETQLPAEPPRDDNAKESTLNLTSKIAGHSSARSGAYFSQFVTPYHAGQAFGAVQRLLRLDKPRDRTKRVDAREREENAQVPERRPKRQETMYEYEHVYYDDDETKRHLLGQQQLDHMRQNLGLSDSTRIQEQFQRDYVAKAQNDPKIRLARMIAENPWYDCSWFIFSNRNVIRRLCQSMTPPAHGERIFGRPVSKWRYYVFQTCIFAAIIGSVVVAGIATPLYRKMYYIKHESIAGAWFSLLEISLSVFFVLEFFVKTIADGFAFTPNAYLLNTWNLLDMIVLASLLINVISELVVVGGVSHFTRALKAFRALRLINLSSLMRYTHIISRQTDFAPTQHKE
jgi:hypothetical protein